MSYGISIINSDDRLLIDDSYPHLYLKVAYPVSAYTAYPGNASYTAGDLVLASCNSSGYIALGRDADTLTTTYLPITVTNETSDVFVAPASGYSIVLASKVLGNLSPANSGYGMEIYSTSGLVYTTNLTNTFKIFAYGEVVTTTQLSPFTLTFPSNIGEFEDLSKIFVLVNNTWSYYRQTRGGLDDRFVGYRYEYTTGNRGRVHFTIQNGASGGIEGISMSYLIMEKI